MSENKLPPYIKIEPEAETEVFDHPFSEFEDAHLHSTMPFVLRRDYYESGKSSGTFRHLDFLALYAVRSGKAVHWIDDQPYGLVRGDVYLMAPGSAHRFSQFSQLELDVFFFQNSFFNTEELAALRQCPGILELFAGGTDLEHRIHASPEEWRIIEAHIETMRKEWGESDPVGGLIMKHEFFRLLVTLARLLSNASHVRGISDDERRPDSGLAEALRYCEENFDKPISVQKLAARAFLSRGHFSALFTREVGMSPAAYVRLIRLDKARALLRDTNIPIRQIASQCGYKNSAQFSRAFRSFYKTSPREYRKGE